MYDSDHTECKLGLCFHIPGSCLYLQWVMFIYMWCIHGCMSLYTWIMSFTHTTESTPSTSYSRLVHTYMRHVSTYNTQCLYICVRQRVGQVRARVLCLYTWVKFLYTWVMSHVHGIYIGSYLFLHVSCLYRSKIRQVQARVMSHIHSIYIGSCLYHHGSCVYMHTIASMQTAS